MTGKTRDVKFDNLIINGSLVLNKEDRPYQTYSEWLTHSEMQRTPHPYNLDFSPKKPRWSYVMGIEMEGMLDTYLHYKDGKSTFKGADAEANNEAIINYLKEYPAKMIDEKETSQATNMRISTSTMCAQRSSSSACTTSSLARAANWH